MTKIKQWLGLIKYLLWTTNTTGIWRILSIALIVCGSLFSITIAGKDYADGLIMLGAMTLFLSFFFIIIDYA